MSDLLIRPCTVDDLAAMAALEAELQDFPWTLKQFAETQSMPDHLAWVAVQAQQIVGFAVTMQVLDEASLLNLGVAKRAQRQGLGKKLVQTAIAAADERSAAVMHLEVRASNKPAQALYRRLGFVEVGRRRAYYRAREGREDALLMALTLDEGGR